MASGVFSSLVRPIKNRAVHLLLFPRIETIAESREILRLIQQYGPVEMFRSLKYDNVSAPNTMIAIYEKDESADQLLGASPLRFHMSPENGGESGPLTHSNATEQQADSSSSAIPARAKHFQLQVNPSTFHHRDQISYNPFNGSFRVSEKSCPIHEDLITKVPLKGLSEFTLNKEEKPWRRVFIEKSIEEQGIVPLRQLLEDASEDTHSSSV